MPDKDLEITILYQALLERQPEPNAFKTHADTPLPQLARNIMKSEEFRRRQKKQGMPPPPEPQPTKKKLLDLGPIGQDRLIYLHIPKCGGTTLHHILTDWYGADAFHPERHNHLHEQSIGELTRYQVFSGHFDFYSTRLIPGRRQLISFLRDPRERLVSLYNFHRAHRPEVAARNNLALARLADEMDIDAYFADPRVRSHPAVDNSIARHFSDVPQAQHLWKGAADQRLNNLKMMYRQAEENLKQFNFIGFMDNYEASLTRLASILNKPLEQRIEQKQVLDHLMVEDPSMRQIEKQRPSAETLAQMDELVLYDLQVYDAARARFAGPDA